MAESLEVRGFFPRAASMIARAIGAAVTPPVPV